MLWLNIQLPAQKISHPAPARTTHPPPSLTHTQPNHTCTHSGVGACTRPANVGIHNPRRLTALHRTLVRMSFHQRWPDAKHLCDKLRSHIL